jgi:hypothetical protein
MKNNYFIPMALNLQLFAEGTGGAGDSGASATDAVSQSTGENTASIKKEDVSPAAEVDKSADDRRAKYEEFLKEFKDLDDERVQGIVKNRLKSSKDSAAKYDALAPTLEVLAKKYGVEPTDIAALNKAIDEDDSYYEQEALEKGVTVKQLKEIRKIEKENASLKKEKEARKREDSAKKIYSSWMDQAEKTKAVYPSFNLEAELKSNPKFGELLKSNIDVKTAYEVIHKDEIIASAMKYTADTVEQKIADNIIAGGSRPSENGNSSQGAATARLDPSTMSKEERAEINRRVLRGEKIRFV